jgi:hypothetical protein
MYLDAGGRLGFVCIIVGPCFYTIHQPHFFSVVKSSVFTILLRVMSVYVM